MKFNFWKKMEPFQDGNLSSEAGHEESAKRLIFKIIIAIIIVCAVINAILLGLVSGKVKSLYRDKVAMAESLSKISAVLVKSPAEPVSLLSFMDCSSLTGYTNTISKQIKSIIEQKNIMTASLKNMAETIHSAELNFSDTNDLNVIQSRIRSLIGYSKKLYDLNVRLSDFMLKMVNLTELPITGKDELSEKLNTSFDSVCLPILENIEKSKKAVGNLQKEIETKTNTIAELKKTIEGASTNKSEFQQTIQKQQNEISKLKEEYSVLKAQIESTVSPGAAKSLTAVTAEPVKKISFPELYHKLKGKVMEYNSKWGFIIINFGSDSKIGITLEGEEKEVNVPAPLNKEVYIARGDKFIAKAKIVNVYSKYSVANIIFPVAEEVKKGDSIFFDQPKNN